MGHSFIIGMMMMLLLDDDGLAAWRHRGVINCSINPSRGRVLLTRRRVVSYSTMDQPEQPRQSVASTSLVLRRPGSLASRRGSRLASFPAC